MRIHFGHTIGLSKLNAAGMVLELQKYMAAAEFNAERDDQGSDGDGEDASSTTGRASLTGSTNSNGTTYYLNMTANYGSQQSESSLISDAKAWMMTIGAGQ